MSDSPGSIENCEGWYLEREREIAGAQDSDEIERVLQQIREHVIAKRCFAYWLSEAQLAAGKALRRLTEKKARGMTYNERNRRVRHMWKIGFNTFEIARDLELTEPEVEQIIFEMVSKNKRPATVIQHRVDEAEVA